MDHKNNRMTKKLMSYVRSIFNDKMAEFDSRRSRVPSRGRGNEGAGSRSRSEQEQEQEQEQGYKIPQLTPRGAARARKLARKRLPTRQSETFPGQS